MREINMVTQAWNGMIAIIASGILFGMPNCFAERFTFVEPHLGTIVELTLYASDETAANEAARAAYARIKELDLIFSDYNSDSEAMRLCQKAGSGEWTPVSLELFELLQFSNSISERTEGRFDVTVGPLVKLWRQSRKQKKLPDPERLREAQQLVSWKLIELREADRSVKLVRPGMSLDFGGIAKGYIADQTLRLLRDRGVPQALVAVAGDIAAGDPPPEAAGWKIGVAPLDPQQRASRRILLKNGAVSTSGDAFQYVEIDGVRYSHIVDPTTGIGLTQRASVTVIAPQGAKADACATAACVMGSTAGLEFIESMDDTAALFVFSADGQIETSASRRFADFQVE